jgi:hypothetical protein
VLLELVVLSFVYLYAFGMVKITASTAPGFDNTENAKSEKVSLCTFVVDTYRLLDVFGTHKLTSKLQSPLNA